jgi:formate hydrogenlyase subunit 3/multisubunit Na+/H+ antiporter MnhD subunit
VLLVVLVCVSSLMDAYLTLLHIQHGGSEANPLMVLALVYGPTTFVGIKMGLTGLGTWFLAAHQSFPLAYKGLHTLALGYGVVLLYHLMLVLSRV